MPGKKEFVMLERPTRGIWKWSLLAACVLTGLFYLLRYTGLFSSRLVSVFFTYVPGSLPAVTMSMVVSEFITDLSRLLSFWSWVTTAKIVLALLLYFLTAWWIARRGASVKAGILAGLWAGLFYGLINLVISAALLIGNLRPFGDDSKTRAYLLALIIVDDVSGFLYGFVLYGLLPGIVGGVLGGFCGRLTKAQPEAPVPVPQQQAE